MPRRRGTLTLRREDGRIICDSVTVADSTARRMRGLLGRRSLATGEGIVLRPAWSIHTAFMRFPIDVVFIDAEQVVMRVEPALRPFKTASCRGAREIVELSAGECERRGLAEGDRVAWASRNVVNAIAIEKSPSLQAERRGTVLVASGDQRFIKLTRFLLEGRGIAVGDQSVADALSDSLADADVDAVLLDAGTSIGDGLRALNAARVQRPEIAVVLVAEAPGKQSPESVRVYDKWHETDEIVDAVEHAVAGVGRVEMASLAGTTSQTDTIVALSRLDDTRRARSTEANRLERLHAFLADGAPAHVIPLLDAARARAAPIVVAGGQNQESAVIAANIYAADVVARLAAEGDLDPTDTQITAGALAETCSIPLTTATFELFQRTVASPTLLELPPFAAAEIQLRLLLHLDIAAGVSLWRRADDGEIECVFSLGVDPTDRQVRTEASAAITGKAGVRLVRSSNLRTAAVYRFGNAEAAIVARIHGGLRRDVRAYFDVAATAMSPLLERELLLDRNTARERALLSTVENRLTRLGFDLHDGPIQDVLVLGSETTRLRDEVYPFVLDSHRELARGRFDDLIARIADLDRQLRETAHSLETKSVTSRPLSEILHREVEAFTERTGIESSVAVHGDPESLSAQQQRIALFRAIQESLSNVREHSGAATVDVRLQVRRGTVDVRVTDDGHGFEVNRSLAAAAERGRLGLVGMGERMRMLGGTFEIDSRLGGPTVLRFSLPRWQPFEQLGGDRS